MSANSVQHMAVIGTGLAGAACAQALVAAGHAVQAVDKARGPGGRLATRRMRWQDAQGQTCLTRMDHGAVGLSAQGAGFRQFLEQAHRAGCMAEWAPRWASPADGPERLWVPVPDQPALSQSLLQGVPATWSTAIDALQSDAAGWRLISDGHSLPGCFDAVVLALPPAQAAPLLARHQPDWARSAALVRMQPCWTLMGVAHDPDDALGAALGGDLDRPVTGPLAWVVRQDARPGRQKVPGQSHWVLHARAGWSRQHLEHDPAWVQAEMQAALATRLGRPVAWLHSQVHRWRYAQPQAVATPHGPSGSCWWSAALGLGVCGDFLGSGGAEGAWLSAQALLAAMAAEPTGHRLAPPAAARRHALAGQA